MSFLNSDNGVGAIRRIPWIASNKCLLSTVIWVSVFLLHSLTYLFLIPAWQAPDEPTSFELLLTMQARNRLVGPGDAIPGIQREIIASMERNHFWEFGGYGGRPLTDEDRNFRTIWRCCETQFNRPPLYQLFLLPAAKLTAPWPIEKRLFLLRFLTVLMGAITVAVITRIACDLEEVHPAVPWVLPAFVALSPQFAYSSATFNADSLVALLGSLIFWRLLRALRSGLTAKALAELVLLIVLGVATKRTIFLALPTVLFALAWHAIATYRYHHRELRPKLFAVAGIPAVMIILVAAVPALRSRVMNLVWRYVLLNVPATGNSLLQQVDAQGLTIQTWMYRNTVFLNHSFWGSFGWHTFSIASLLSDLLLALIVVSWLSFLIWLWWSRGALPNWGVRFVSVCALGGVVAVLLTIIGTPPQVLPQGRYLFPVLVPIFLPMTIGICCWMRGRSMVPGRWIIVAGLLALDLYAIFGVVIPAFRR